MRHRITESDIRRITRKILNESNKLSDAKDIINKYHNDMLNELVKELELDPTSYVRLRDKMEVHENQLFNLIESELSRQHSDDN